MIENLPAWVDVVFLCTTAATILLFHYGNGRHKASTLFVIGWSVLHAALAWNDFYRDTESIPPRFALILIPSTLLIVVTCLPKFRGFFLKRRDPRIASLIHLSEEKPQNR